MSLWLLYILLVSLASEKKKEKKKKTCFTMQCFCASFVLVDVAATLCRQKCVCVFSKRIESAEQHTDKMLWLL